MHYINKIEQKLISYTLRLIKETNYKIYKNDLRREIDKLLLHDSKEYKQYVKINCDKILSLLNLNYNDLIKIINDRNVISKTAVIDFLSDELKKVSLWKHQVNRFIFNKIYFSPILNDDKIKEKIEENYIIINKLDYLIVKYDRD